MSPCNDIIYEFELDCSFHPPQSIKWRSLYLYKWIRMWENKVAKYKSEVKDDLRKKEHRRKFQFFLDFMKPIENIILRKLSEVA